MNQAHHAMYLDKSEHFPGCSEAESINTLAPSDLFRFRCSSAAAASPLCFFIFHGCRSIYALSFRAPRELFTFHIHGTVRP